MYVGVHLTGWLALWFSHQDWLSHLLILSQDSTATTYTVFCADASDCQISGPLPFTFAEGPSTFRYSGSIESQLLVCRPMSFSLCHPPLHRLTRRRTAVISCQLASTTAATCTEYSSFGSNFNENNITGPTETTRTVTYSGTEIQWGTLVMTTPSPASNTASPTVDPDGAFDPSDTAWYFPSPTSTSWSEERSNPRSALLLSVSVLAAAFML